MNQKRKSKHASCIRWIFLLSRVSLPLIFLIGICVEAGQPAYAALSFDGQDDYASVQIGKEFSKLTLMVWVNPETFFAKRETFAAWVRAVEQPRPPAGGYIARATNRFVLYQSKGDWRNWGFEITTDQATVKIPSSKPLTASNTWVFIAVTYNGETDSV